MPTGEIEMQSVRIEKPALERVRKYVKETRQTVGGFISILIDREMDKVDNRKKAQRKKDRDTDQLKNM